MTQKTEIDSSYIKASKTVSSLVWTLLNALDTNDAEPDALSNHDKDLLIDVLRYGTVAEVARVRKSTIEIIRKQYSTKGTVLFVFRSDGSHCAPLT